MEREIPKILTIAPALLCVAVMSLAGCSGNSNTAQSDATVERQVIIVKQPPPAGVEENCWQEPQVRTETEGPGVDDEGKWYRPHHETVRMVKGGRWLKCAEAK